MTRNHLVSALGVQVEVQTNLDWPPEQPMFKMWDTSVDETLSVCVSIAAGAADPGWDFTADGDLNVSLGRADVGPVANPYFSSCLYAAEIRRQRAGIFHLHAAALALGQGAVLLAGDSGAGKTVTTLRLSSERNVRYGGADRCQIGIRDGKLSLVGHWRHTRLRSSSVAKLANLSALQSRLSPDVRNWLKEARRGWDVKRTCSVDELGFDPLLGSAPVVAIYDLRVLSPGTPLEVKQLLPRDAIFALTASVNDLTSGFLMLLDDDAMPIMRPFASAIEAGSEQKQELIRAARNVARYRLRGGPEEIAEYLLARHHS